TFGYTATQGDSILMRGRLTHFNGLHQLDFLDTIIFFKSNAQLKTPVVKNTVDEEAENDLVQINNVQFVAPAPPTWGVSGSGSNYKVYNTVTNDTFEIRILPVNNLANTPVPTGVFNVVGLGGQYDFSSPYTSGYQLFPRDINDIIVNEIGDFDLISPANNTTIQLAGDPAQTAQIVWSNAEALNSSPASEYTFMLDLPTGDFSNPVASFDAGTDTTLTFTYGQLADAFSATLTPGNSLTLLWTVEADNGNMTKMAQSQYLITFERGVIDGIISATQIAR